MDDSDDNGGLDSYSATMFFVIRNCCFGSSRFLVSVPLETSLFELVQTAFRASDRRWQWKPCLLHSTADCYW